MGSVFKFFAADIDRRRIRSSVLAEVERGLGAAADGFE
jgi:hypothetical protein